MFGSDYLNLILQEALPEKATVNLSINTQVFSIDRGRSDRLCVSPGNLKAAADLRRILGRGNIEAASIGDLESHLTIRVGKDWDNQ